LYFEQISCLFIEIIEKIDLNIFLFTFGKYILQNNFVYKSHNYSFNMPVHYYTIKVKRPDVPFTEEQQKTINSFAKAYGARVVPGQQLVFLDFQCSRKLIPLELKKELQGLEVTIFQ